MSREPLSIPSEMAEGEALYEKVTRFIDDRQDRIARGELTAWDIVCKIEDDVAAVSEFATVFMIMASGDDLEGDVAAAFNRVAWTLKATGQRLSEARGELFRMLHPCPDAERTVGAAADA
ncbi:hypothetical protein [Rhodoplanes sp. SY1]|uniref:hypothetical protein n=1 Tax=Rhodoplanes sp. SY1 TaxID=3166646 RepID=UPI0038B42E4F